MAKEQQQDEEYIHSNLQLIKSFVPSEELSELLSDRRYAEILARTQTQVFVHEKPSTTGLRVLISMNDPGSYIVGQKLLQKMIDSSRIQSLAVLASGPAAVGIQSDFENKFQKLNSPDGRLFPTLLGLVEQKPFDIAIATTSTQNGPEGIILYGAKSVFGAKKLYFISEGWTGIGQIFHYKGSDGSLNRTRMDSIDNIICNDELAERIIADLLPEYPAKKILSIGTPVLETVKSSDGGKLRIIGRQKLKLNEDVWAMLYLGQVDKDFIGLDPDINAKTLTLSIEAFKKLAKKNSGRKYAFLFRPHPRDYIKQEDLFKIIDNFQFPENVEVRKAMHPLVTMDEVAWATDCVASIHSTENFLACARGKPAIFLCYNESGLGAEAIAKSFSSRILKTLLKNPKIKVVNTVDQIVKELDFFSNTKSQPPNRLDKTDYAQKIIDQILTF